MLLLHSIIAIENINDIRNTFMLVLFCLPWGGYRCTPCPYPC